MTTLTKQQQKLLLILVGCALLIVGFIAFFHQSQPSPQDLEQQARAFLIEKYHPSACYGMPRIVHKGEPGPEPKLELSQKYNMGFEYEVWDGHCCSITIYKGNLTYSNNKFVDNLTSNETKQVPC